MTDNEITREKTFSEELPYFKERIKEVFDNYDNPNGYEDPLYIAVLRDSKRIVRKAEEEITRQQAEIENLKVENQSLRGAANSLKMHYEEAQAEIERLQYLLDEEEKKYTICAKHFYKEAIKECLAKVKNYIKTHCNPYGKPDFDYDTSIKILNFIDNLAKEMAGDDNE